MAYEVRWRRLTYDLLPYNMVSATVVIEGNSKLASLSPCILNSRLKYSGIYPAASVTLLVKTKMQNDCIVTQQKTTSKEGNVRRLWDFVSVLLMDIYF